MNFDSTIHRKTKEFIALKMNSQVSCGGCMNFAKSHDNS